MATIDTIGLDGEQRSDFALREIFVEAYNLIAPNLDEQGRWLSLAHECLAGDALHARFPDITGGRLFAVLGHIAAVRASGRTPVDQPPGAANVNESA